MKKLIAILASTLIILLGACAGQPERLDTSEKHKALLEQGVRPYMKLSPELMAKWVDPIDNKPDGWKITGIGVDYRGNFMLWAENFETKECIALIVANDGRAMKLSCERADEIHYKVCVELEKCNDNPYIDGDA